MGSELPPSLEIAGSDVFEPVEVLQWQLREEGGEEIWQVLVQWKGQSRDEATWIDEAG